jgi:hypothetical protein
MRVELGRLKVGDEFSIAHFRYRLEEFPDSDGIVFRLPPPRDLLSPNSRIPLISRN